MLTNAALQHFAMFAFFCLKLKNNPRLQHLLCTYCSMIAYLAFMFDNENCFLPSEVTQFSLRGSIIDLSFWNSKCDTWMSLICVWCVQVEQCVWRRHCGGGAVFSSPYLLSTRRQLFVASLGGHLLCLSPVSKKQTLATLTCCSDSDMLCFVCLCMRVHPQDSGEVLWSVCRDVPFFSSPNGSSGQVIIGSVDGNICCFSTEGKQVRNKSDLYSSYFPLSSSEAKKCPKKLF